MWQGVSYSPSETQALSIFLSTANWALSQARGKRVVPWPTSDTLVAYIPSVGTSPRGHSDGRRLGDSLAVRLARGAALGASHLHRYIRTHFYVLLLFVI